MADRTAPIPAALGGMPAELAARLWAHAMVVKARSGRTLVALGANSTNVYVVLEGRAQARLFSLSGRQVTLRDLGEGAIFGELAAIDPQPRSASIVATTDCVLASIDAASFRAAISELPVAALWIAARLTRQIRDLTDRVFELNALRVRDRLHCELLRMCGDIAGRPRITLDPSPTHADLASRIGTHREAVTRELSYLAEKGVVEQRNRRIVVTDVAALAGLVRSAGGDVTAEP